MTFITKQAVLLRSARRWGVLGLALALAITVGYGQGDKQSPQVTQSGLFAVESSAPAPMGAGSYSRHARNAALAQQPPPCVPPPPGLVAWWPLDGLNPNGEYDDLANFDNNGTPIGNPATIPGYVNNALQAGSGYVQVTPASNLNFSTGPFTIDAWVKFTPTPGTQTEPIVHKLDASGGYFLYIATDNQGNSDLRLQIGTQTFLGPPITVPKGTWIFVAATRAGSVVTLRVNNDPPVVASVMSPPNATSSTPLWIGRWTGNPHASLGIDEVEIFNRALDQKELDSIFNAGSAGKCKPTLLPDLTVNKQVMCSGPVTPQGIKCTITFTITNNGPGTFNGILVINDTVTPPPSPGISWAGPSTPAGWNCAISPPNSIGCSSAALGGAPASVTLGPIGSTTFSVDVYIPNGQYKNCVEVKGYTQFPYTPSTLIQEVTFANNQHCVDFQSGELKKCDLEISKSLAHGIVPPLQPGQQVTFEIIVTNVGTGPCDPPIPVTDTFTGMTYQSGGQIMGPWTCPPGSSATPVTCNYSGTSATPLQPGQSSNFFVNFTVTAKPGEAVENCAEVKHPNDTNPNNNKACIKVPVAEPKEKCDLKITKTVQPNPVQSGQQVTITLTVQNGPLRPRYRRARPTDYRTHGPIPTGGRQPVGWHGNVGLLNTRRRCQLRHSQHAPCGLHSYVHLHGYSDRCSTTRRRSQHPKLRHSEQSERSPQPG
jgi:hypothetical protein